MNRDSNHWSKYSVGTY